MIKQVKEVVVGDKVTYDTDMREVVEIVSPKTVGSQHVFWVTRNNNGDLRHYNFNVFDRVEVVTPLPADKRIVIFCEEIQEGDIILPLRTEGKGMLVLEVFTSRHDVNKICVLLQLTNETDLVTYNGNDEVYLLNP